MKILYLSAAMIPSEISHTLSIMRLCQAFADQGHQVTLSAVASPHNPADPVEYYGLRGGFDVRLNAMGKFIWNRVMRKLLASGLALAFKTRRLVEEIKPDLIYSRLTIAELALVPRDIPIIYETHSLGPLGQSWWQNLAFRWIMRHKNIRRIIVTTRTMADLVREKLPRIEVAVAPLSAEEPGTANETLPALPGKNDFKIGYTGYMDVDGYRGIDILVELAAAMPDCDFHLVGGTPEAVAHWSRVAETDNIFFHGYQRSDLIPSYLRLFDVVVSPLQRAPVRRAPTGKGLSLLKIPQYMGCGKAIVASDLPAHQEVLEEGRTALLVPHDDIQAWKEALRRLKDDSGLRRALEQNARADYSLYFTPARRVEKILGGLKEKTG
ncbi:MAG TPA: glycosyltransferase [Micavibrio sp.]|jgi:glycosyltransferase involved in cell wall biosynthesis